MFYICQRVRSISIILISLVCIFSSCKKPDPISIPNDNNEKDSVEVMLYTTDTKGQSTPVQVFSEGEYFGFARFALSAPECENYSYERRKVEAGRTYFFTAYVRNEEREIVFNSKNAPQGECIKINFK